MTTPTVSLPGRLSVARIKELTTAQGPCITLVLPHSGGDSFRIKIKEVARQVEDSAPALAASVRAVLSNAAANGVQPGTFVLLQCGALADHFETPELLREEVSIGPRFSIRALLPLFSRPPEFLLLALSQNRTRVLRCTATTSEELALPAGVPTSLADAMQTVPPDHVLDNRSTGGPSTGSMRGVMFGTTTEREDKYERLLQFFSALNRGLHPLFGDLPVVPVGVEHELALYRTVNTHPHLVEPGVHGSPDGLKGGEMHRRALELLSVTLPEPIRCTLENFDKQVGTGHASVHAQEIVKAAFEGRVSSLFLQPDAEYRGDFDNTRKRVHHGDSSAENDLLNDAIVQTIANGGFAAVLPASAMPQGVPVCAIFRYPL